MKKSFSKISIITPVYNQLQFIEQTILSVLKQDYDNFEYIIIDGGSTDGTVDIIKKYEKHLTKWISEPDKGMYDAISKGFSYCNGDIMAWINSDDILAPNAFKNMNMVFNDLPSVNWIQGLNGFVDLKGNIVRYTYPNQFSFLKFLAGDYKFIQQESTFWRRSLWEKAGNFIDRDLKLAGDFELWFRFFQYDRLYTVNIPIGGWRKREGQLSGIQMDSYEKEVKTIIQSYDKSEDEKMKLKKLSKLKKVSRILKKSKIFNYKILDRRISICEELKKTEIIYSYIHEKFIIK